MPDQDRSVPDTATVVNNIAAALEGFGGLLRCAVCGAEKPLGDIGHKLTTGWPKHCTLTMRWVTARELAEESRG